MIFHLKGGEIAKKANQNFSVSFRNGECIIPRVFRQ